MALQECSPSFILQNGGKIIENQDGTVSVFVSNGLNKPLIPKIISLNCCQQLNTNYFFDSTKQKCYWTDTPSQTSCKTSDVFKLVLNPNGNDGAIFTDEVEETCTLGISFDYLFKFDCNTLSTINGTTPNTLCPTISSVFENIAASAMIETIEPSGGNNISTIVYSNTFFNRIGTGNLYTYLNGKSADTGFYVCGNLTTNTSDTNCYDFNLYDLNINNDKLNCINVQNQLVTQLSTQANLPLNSLGIKNTVAAKAFASNWLKFTTEVTDPNIIKLISNKKIKLSLQLSGACLDTCVLVDNIKLNKNCTKVTRKDIFSSKVPGFNLDRVRDNKKSWIATTETTRRTHSIAKSDGTQPIRYTDYYLDDEREVINSKEIDLDINLAAAIETDVWCYISDNPCILTGNTIGTTFCTKDVGYYVSGSTILTAITSQTSVAQVFCITSTTVPTTTIYTCPAGFTATSNNESCQKIDSYNPQFLTSGPIITAGAKLSTYSSSVYFYPSIENNGALPVYYQLGGGAPLLNQTGGTITPLVINSTNVFWVSNGATTSGRLNVAGVVSDSTQWVGFSECITVTQGGTYYIGIGADDYCKVKVDGKLVILLSGSSYNSAISERWSVFPFYLTSGKHVIEIEGLNGSSTSAFAAEIYKPTSFVTLTGATNSGPTQANVIFSTINKIGGTYDLSSSATSVSTIGYKCLDGFVVDKCNAQVSCSRIINSAVTTTIIPSYTLTGYCNEVRAITSTTTPYNVLFGSYSCPTGFSATPGNDVCQKITTLSATFNNSNGPTITSGNKFGSYNNLGTRFYTGIQNSGSLPFTYSGTSDILRNQTGGTLTPTATVNSGTLWYNPSTTIYGRLNNAGIITTNDGTQWVGFTECINIDEAGTYYIGLGADNFCQFSIDGQLVVALTGNSLNAPVLPCNPETIANDKNFRYWNVFEWNFTSGQHIITMLGLNQCSDPWPGSSFLAAGASNPKAFAAEIYKPTSLATLTAATSTGQTGLVFSTASQVGKTYSVGTTIGFSCPVGFSLSNCNKARPALCQTIETTAITLTLSSDTKYQITSGYCRDNALTCVTPTYSSQTTTSTGYSFTTKTTLINQCEPKIYCCSEYCGDVNHCHIQVLFTEPLSDVTTVEDFQHYVNSQLIDAKDRKTLSSYPTLRLLYERYMNSLAYCTTKSSKFDYRTMNNFANLIGNYWVDLIEQVVPATTIWGSTRIYTNTIFDNQKFAYKGYSLFFGNNTKRNEKVLSPATGDSCNANATTLFIKGASSGTTLFYTQGDKADYDNVFAIQMNSGSEFINFITIVGPTSPCKQKNGINDCLLQATISNNIGTNGTITANAIGASTQPSYFWLPTSATTQSIGNLTAGTTYSVTINDECCEATATFSATCNLNVTINSNNPNAGQNDGNLTAVATGKRGTLSYQWKNNLTSQVIGNTSVIGGLSGGSYSVTVTDSGLIGCSITANTSIYEQFKIQAKNLNSINGTGTSQGMLVFSISTVDRPIILWGDNTTTTVPIGALYAYRDHTYSSPYTGDIIIQMYDLSNFRSFGIFSTTPSSSAGTPSITVKTTELNKLDELFVSIMTEGYLTGSVNDLPKTSNLYLYGTYYNNLSGGTGELPRYLTNATITGLNTITGNTLDLPRGLTYLDISGKNTVSGNTSDLPSGLTTVTITGDIPYLNGGNTISGSLSGLPRNLNYINITGNNRISGDTSNLPSGTTFLNLLGYNTISGDVTNIPRFSAWTRISVYGYNSLSGDVSNLPSTLTYVDIQGTTGTTVSTSGNSISGNIANIPSATTTFTLFGINSVSGNVSSLPTTLNEFIVGGYNTISGDVKNLPTSLKYLKVEGRNKIQDFTTPKTWSNPMNYLYIKSFEPSYTGFSTTEVDNLIISLSSVTWTINTNFKPLETRLEIQGTPSYSAPVLTALNAMTGTNGLNYVKFN